MFDQAIFKFGQKLNRGGELNNHIGDAAKVG